MNLQSIQAFIKEQLGLHCGEQPNAQWRVLLTNRIASVGAASAEAYLAHLRTDEHEIHTLASLLTINETYFYREAQHLKLLTERLCPELLTRKPPAQPIRILSVGCSTGEEPYSILMALRERYGELTDTLFDLHAGDVDQAVLERARAGIYSPFSFRALSPALIERYFDTVEGGSLRRIDDVIRQRANFLPLNLLAPEYPAVLQGQDVVFFRNVSIYFDAPTRALVLTRLKTLLNPGGFLIVGTAETLANDIGVLTLRELDGVFFFADAPREQAAPPPLIRSSVGAPARCNPDRPATGIKPSQPLARPAKAPVTESPDTLYQEALALTRAERFDDALEQLAPLCANSTPRIQDLTLQAHLLLERGDTPGASAAAKRALAIDPWYLDALLLLGRLAQGQGDGAGAIGHLRRAIYHRPQAWQAHFQLAECYREGGQSELARREYRVVLHQLEQQHTTESGRAVGPNAHSAEHSSSLPLPYSLRDLRLLCETRLSRLDATAG
ncbi:CheR family methyltransferase [Rhabdochromatium marinum]|uniref:CheR family methyltransferase n=1 Tax=Rhabdochromatium marinum TaxID=48729 RepID=UPI001907F459|nr:protein-glutamate O-methyltransferase CheR [Rhabdochromatium marinum]